MTATMMMKVEDAVRAISNVDDYAGSAKARAATTLRSNKNPLKSIQNPLWRYLDRFPT